MKQFFMMAMLVISGATFAQDDFDNRYGGASEEFEVMKFDDASIMLRIHQEAKISCNEDGLCTLFSVTNEKKEYSVEFSVGESSNGYANMNGGSNGSVVVVPGNGSYSSEPQPYVGLVLRMTKGTCTQKVNVPMSLYVSMNSYMYHLVNSDGTPKRGFTPADETMIMFYTTIMKQATGCK